MYVGSMCACAKSNVCPVVIEVRNLLYYEVEADYYITNTREAGKRYPHIGSIVGRSLLQSLLTPNYVGLQSMLRHKV